MGNIYKTWTNLKSLLANKELYLQYDEQEYFYTIFIEEVNSIYFTELWKDTSQVKGIDITQNNLDISDFENNYKATANAGQRINIDVKTGDVNVNIEDGMVGIVDKNLIQINPATNEKIQEVIQALEDLDLNLTSSGVDITVDTTELENKVQSVRDQLDVLLSTRASEETSQAILDALGTESGTDILHALQNLNVDIDVSGLATEATLLEIKGYLDTVETKLQSIIDALGNNLANIKSNTDKLDVLLSTRASESTSQEISDRIGQESGTTLSSWLKNIWDKLVELFNNGLAKVKIWDGNETVEVVTKTGDVNRLAVDIGDNVSVSVSSDESPTKFQLRSSKDFNITLNTLTDTQLFSFTGQGVIDLVAINSAVSSNWEAVIEIDGTERIRISMEQLGSTLGLTNSAYDIVAETANKQFRYRPMQIGFKTSFRVLAKATVSNPAVNYIVLYREKVA